MTTLHNLVFHFRQALIQKSTTVLFWDFIFFSTTPNEEELSVYNNILRYIQPLHAQLDYSPPLKKKIGDLLSWSWKNKKLEKYFIFNFSGSFFNLGTQISPDGSTQRDKLSVRLMDISNFKISECYVCCTYFVCLLRAPSKQESIVVIASAG